MEQSISGIKFLLGIVAVTCGLSSHAIISRWHFDGDIEMIDLRHKKTAAFYLEAQRCSKYQGDFKDSIQ